MKIINLSNFMKTSFMQKAFPIGLVTIVSGLLLSLFIYKKPLSKVSNLPGLEKYDNNNDNKLDLYESVKYARKVFDIDNDGKLSLDEISYARYQIKNAEGYT